MLEFENVLNYSAKCQLNIEKKNIQNVLKNKNYQQLLVVGFNNQKNRKNYRNKCSKDKNDFKIK